MTENSVPYVFRLGGKLGDGVSRLPGPFRLRQVRWLLAAQQADGGFAGRMGSSDLYYTAFALRAAEMLRVEERFLYARAAGFLERLGPAAQDAVDAFSLLITDRILAGHGISPWQESPEKVADTVLEALERCRVPEGGYGKPGAGASVYHTFIALLSLEMLARPLPDREAILALLRKHEGPDGGFADQGGSDAEGANPTAAATVLLCLLAPDSPDLTARAADFLSGLQRDDGGFPAHATAPVADLMSTFTALAALDECARPAPRVKLAAAGRFVQQLSRPEGGFRSSPADNGADVEYAYYGLGTLGLLAAHAAAARCCACRGRICRS